MSDEQRRGVHLSEKEIVFGVMAASVVVVVAFLCGVFVGRGVQALRPAPADTAAPVGAVVPDAVPPAAEVDQAPPLASAGGGTSAPPDNLTYPGRLGGQAPPPESLSAGQPPPQPPPEVPADAGPAAGGAPATAKAPTVGGNAAGGASASPAPTPPVADITVQIAAVRRKAEAQAIVDKLVKKGYPAYVYTPPPGDRTGGFRVRVGWFKSREEAEAMASRLRKEEQYKPWIIR